MDSVSREIEILSKNQKDMLWYRKQCNNITKMKHAFDGFISRPDRAEESISEIDNILIEPS